LTPGQYIGIIGFVKTPKRKVGRPKSRNPYLPITTSIPLEEWNYLKEVLPSPPSVAARTREWILEGLRKEMGGKR
jgi:hypothetical protein